MANFPTTLKISTRSQQLDRDGRVIDTDADGLARIRKLHPDRADFTLVLDRMTGADKTALFNHYAANPSTFNFLFPPDGVTYTVKYGARPRLADYKKGFFTYEVKLLAG